jgi:hypothetical protein
MTQTLYGLVDRRTEQLAINPSSGKPYLYRMWSEAEDMCTEHEKVVKVQVTYEYVRRVKSIEMQ